MSESGVKFSRLRELLAALGFSEVAVSDFHVGFKHAASDTLIVLPDYKPAACVAPHHLVQVRVMLDAKALLDGEEFDRRLVGISSRHPASS